MDLGLEHSGEVVLEGGEGLPLPGLHPALLLQLEQLIEGDGGRPARRAPAASFRQSQDGGSTEVNRGEQRSTL